MTKTKIVTQIALFIGFVVLFNLISNNVFFRLDFTADKRYTLSKATKDILKNLDDIVTVKAYFSSKLPPQLVNNQKEFEDQLIEYESLSGGNIVYEFIDPKDEETEREAQINGINPIIINVQENDRTEQLKAYMGAILQMDDRKEIIPLVEPGGSMEYMLTSAIKKLSLTNKPKIAFLQGHGEPSLKSSSQVRGQLSILYDVETYTLTDTTDIPSHYKAIAIINPSDTLQKIHLEKLDTYLAQGGGIYLAYDYMQVELSRNYLPGGKDVGLKEWLEEKGIAFRNTYLIDANCGAVSVRQQLPPFGVVNTQVSFPYFPTITTFSDHPVVKGLEALQMQFVNPIDIEAKDSAISYTPLAKTSSKAGSVSAPTFIDINRKWTDGDFTQGNQTIAIAAEGPLIGDRSAKLVIISNGSFSVNGPENQAQKVPEDNSNFTVNAIDWLSDDTGLIDLRTKGVTSRPIKQLEDGKKAIIKYGNVFVPILLLLIYALIRREQHLRKRQKWIVGDI